MPSLRGSRVPRAIQTRGTPDGYYEIPSNILIRLYFNNTTGVWPTDQTNNQPSGLVGYEGVSFSFTFKEIIIHFGNNGSISTSSTIVLPNQGDIGGVFDQYKHVRTEMEFWLSNQSSNYHTTSAANPEFWVAYDPNDALPPSSTQIQSYNRSTRVLTDRPTRVTHYPKVILDAATDAGIGTTTAGGPIVNTYMKTGTTDRHVGTKMYYWIPKDPDGNSFAGYINIKFRIVRRFKTIV